MVRTILCSMLLIALSAGTTVLAQEAGSGGPAGGVGTGESSGAGGTTSGAGGADGTGGTSGTGSGTSTGATDAGGTTGGPVGSTSGGGSTSTAGGAGTASGVGSTAGDTGPGTAPAAGGTANSGAIGGGTTGAAAPATSVAGPSPSPAAPPTSNAGTTGVGLGTGGGRDTGVSATRGGGSGTVSANVGLPETAGVRGPFADRNDGPGDSSWLLPASLAPVAVPARNARGPILDSLQAQDPLIARPGTSLAIVSACRDSLIEASRLHGVVRVDAASAGRPRTGRKGAIAAPIEARIAYARSDRMQVRQSRVTCHLSATGIVTAIR
jgi:hypothetical protein